MSTVATLLHGLDRATVLAAMTPQLPIELVMELLVVARARDIEISLLVADLTGEFAFLDTDARKDCRAGRLKVTVLAGSVPPSLVDHVEHLPVSLWEADRLIASGALDIDVFLARVGRSPDGRGTFGDAVGYSPSAILKARRSAFEVAPVDRVYDGAGLDLSSAELLVGVPESSSIEPARTDTGRTGATLTQLRIAELTAGLLPDGATVQLGVGVVPGEIAARLACRRDLGLHSGILPGSVQKLLASGAASGARKPRERYRHVATGLLGGSPGAWGSRILLQPLSVTHDPKVLLQLDNLWALNSAYEVDLNGQVNAEYVGGQRRSSGGGQSDFAKAAHAGRGASIISLPARASDGTPRIVPRLGCPVTTPAADVDIVVTEYGVAHLSGQTASQRARELIAIAHPDDRPRLRGAVVAEDQRRAG